MEALLILHDILNKLPNRRRSGTKKLIPIFSCKNFI